MNYPVLKVDAKRFAKLLERCREVWIAIVRVKTSITNFGWMTDQILASKIGSFYFLCHKLFIYERRMQRSSQIHYQNSADTEIRNCVVYNRRFVY